MISRFYPRCRRVLQPLGLILWLYPRCEVICSSIGLNLIVSSLPTSESDLDFNLRTTFATAECDLYLALNGRDGDPRCSRRLPAPLARHGGGSAGMPPPLCLE